ncbi:hypothetical protein TNCV_6571 [Trichonephila clavipes]|nr:hypothetical protein TNCV_6571 [Trichonephila clavipes]
MRELLTTDLIILSHSQALKTTPELWHFTLLTSVPSQGCGSSVVMVSNHGRHVMNSSPVPPSRVRPAV